MAWTSPRTWVALEKPTAATMNTHIRDNLKSLGDTWTPYVPTIVGTAAPTVSASYIQMGAQTVHVRYLITLTAAVTATMTMSVPVNFNASYLSTESIGTAQFRDNSTSARFVGIPVAFTSSTLVFYFSNGTSAAGAISSGANPWTWAAGDTIGGILTYQGA